MSSHLRITILKMLSQKEMTGYDLAKEIHAQTGSWKPSFGSIYPILNDLLKKGLVQVNTEGRRKIYHITPQGTKWFKEFNKNKEEIFSKMMENIKQFEIICDKKECDFIQRWHAHLKDNPAPFKEVTKDVYELADALIAIASREKKLREHKKEIKELLQKVSRRLREIERS